MLDTQAYLKMQIQSSGKKSEQGTARRKWHPLFKRCNAVLVSYLLSLRAGFKLPTTALFIFSIDCYAKKINALYLAI